MFHSNFGLPEQIRMLPLLPCPTVSNANPGRGRKAPRRRTTEIRRLPTTLVHIAVRSRNVDEGVMLAEAKNESPTKYLAKLWLYHNANICKYDMSTSMMFLSTTKVGIDLRVPQRAIHWKQQNIVFIILVIISLSFWLLFIYHKIVLLLSLFLTT